MKLTDVMCNAIRGKRLCLAVLIVLMGVTAVWGDVYEYVLYYNQINASYHHKITARSNSPLSMSGNHIYTTAPYVELIVEIADQSVFYAEYKPVLAEDRIYDSSSQNITIRYMTGSISLSSTETGILNKTAVLPDSTKKPLPYKRYIYKLNAGELYTISFNCLYTYHTIAKREKPSTTGNPSTGSGRIFLNVIQDQAGPETTFPQ